MNALRNQVQLIGNLGREVDFKELNNGKALARVSLATSEVYTNKEGEKVTSVQWHNVIGWGGVAENMKALFNKGKQVAVKGKLVHRSYEDQERQKRRISEIVVNEFMLVN